MSKKTLIGLAVLMALIGTASAQVFPPDDFEFDDFYSLFNASYLSARNATFKENVTLNYLKSCKGALDTDSLGRVFCNISIGGGNSGNLMSWLYTGNIITPNVSGYIVNLSSPTTATDMQLLWPNLTGYPSACNSTSTITTFGDSISCTSVRLTEDAITDLVHTTDTNASTACSGSEVLFGNGTCSTPILYETNVTTICSGGQSLLANGSCFNVDTIDRFSRNLMPFLYDGQYYRGNISNANISLGSAVGLRLALFDDGASDQTGLGIQTNLLQAIGDNANVDFTYGVGTSGSLTRLFTVEGTGRVGINTTAPETKLDIHGSGTDNLLNITDGGSDVMFIDSAGEVGIGTASPSLTLDVNSGGTNSIAIFQSTDDKGLIQIRDTDTNTFLMAKDNLFSIGPSTTDQTMFNVNINTGRVGINTTTPQNTLNVVGTANITGDLYVDTNTLYVNSALNRVGVGKVPSYDFDVSGTINAGSVYRLNAVSVISAAGADLQFGDNSNANTNLRMISGIGEAMRIGSTGFIGINTTSPGALLEVKSGNFDTRLTGNQLRFNRDGDSSFIDQRGTGNIQFRTGSGSTNRMIITGAGKVGINTTTPQQTLNVDGEANFTRNFTVDATTLFVDSAGNKVGIGTTNPEELLHIKAVTGNNDAKLIIQAGGENNDAHLMLTTGFQGNTYHKTAIVAEGLNTWNRADLNFILNSDANTNDYVLGTDTRMIIKNSGKVGINTTSPTHALHVVQDANISRDLFAGRDVVAVGQLKGGTLNINSEDIKFGDATDAGTVLFYDGTDWIISAVPVNDGESLTYCSGSSPVLQWVDVGAGGFCPL